MKVELTAIQQKQLDNAIKENIVHKWFSIKDSIKFEVGDILVKHIKSWDRMTGTDSWMQENIMSDNKMAQRYVYIYEDAFVIGYLKALKVSDGKLGKELFCMTDFDFVNTRFEVDPEYAEHCLLDADFNIKAVHKKASEGRKVIANMNRKIGVKIHTLKEFNDYFSKLKVGDIFFNARDFTGKYCAEFIIKKIKIVSVASLNANSDYTWRKWKERNPSSLNASDAYEIVACNIKYNTDQTLSICDSNGDVFFLQKPAKVETT